MRIITSLIIITLTHFSFGQCTIDYTPTSTGIYPDTMPTGYVGQAYDTDITFFMPLDTLGYDFTNFKILSVSLPVGLNWECNNAANGCNYNPQQSQYGCVNIAGTPLLAGQYSVDVTVIADLTIVQGYPFTFQIYLEILPSNVTTSNDGFTMVGAAGCSPITVDFTNNNPGLLAYNWNFGNGNISTSENPAPQVYNAPGDYVVNYTAYGNLDTVYVYTLTNVTVNSMSNYGNGFPSYDVADTYIKVERMEMSFINQVSLAIQIQPFHLQQTSF
jgi:PKD repeat protein